MKDLLTIGEVADFLGVSTQTIRRWDTEGRLLSVRTSSTGHRYFRKADLEAFLATYKDVVRLARAWAFRDQAHQPLDAYYCPDIDVFRTGLERLGTELGKIDDLRSTYPLLTAATGEIGNNSFDHNLGNWPDIRGIFFGYDLKRRAIAIADRGQGVLATLRRVRPDLQTPSDALKVAFTEIVSGRSPESRGNGLKFVREAIIASGASLIFQSGDARLELADPDHQLKFMRTPVSARGCLAVISF